MLSVFGLLLLSGCSIFQSPQTTELSGSADSLTHWRASGKIGFKTPEERGSANFIWTQAPNDFELRLSGPFGQGGAIIKGNPGQVTLSTGKGSQQTSKTLELLMQNNFGWSLPMESLLYWSRGLAAPGTPIHSSNYDDEGRLSELNQNGWQLRYTKYQSINNTLTLPNKLIATREGLRLVIVFNHWQR